MQRNELIRNAMEEMGWNPDSDIPMANEENMCLLKELDELFEQKSELLEKQAHSEERFEKLIQHTKNAETSINHNLKLLHAHQTEVHTEAHLYKLAERKHSKFKEDLKNISKELENTKKFEEKVSKELCNRKHSIDEMTNRIKWAKTALIEWQQAMEDGHKGYLLIERYFKEDKLKAERKNTRRQLLQDEIEKYRKELIVLSDEQKALEQNLECTAGLYRSSHAERRQMVETWKTAVSQMLQRENDIQAEEKVLVQLKIDSREKENKQKSYDNKLTDIITNNKEVETSIDELNSDTSVIKEQIQMLMDMVILKENEVDILQKELQNLSSRVHQQRVENRQNEKQKNDKLNELESFQEVIGKLHERCTSMDNTNLNAQQRLQILEDLNDAEDKTQQQIKTETSRINDLIYRSQQQLTKLKSDEKIYKVGNAGLETTMAAVRKNMQKTEKELQRQTELNYNLGFKMLKMEREIIKLSGGVIDPELEHRNLKQLAQLEDQYLKAKRRLHSTEAQNKKLDDNMRKLTLSYNEDREELEVIQFKIKEAQSYFEGGVTKLKNDKNLNQTLIVELSLLKMRANQFEKEIASCEQSVFNLQKHRHQLNRTIKDRIVEINSQYDLLYVKRKHLCEEKGTLRADIGERNKHIDAVRARFDLSSKLLGYNEDGTLVTATQLKVENAQEKQLLLDEGNVLNERVLKAEEEIKAMENTLMLLNNSNDAYRKNFKKNEEADDSELKLLQADYCKALNQLKNVRNKIFKLTQHNENAIEQREELENKLETVTRKRLESSEILTKLQKELLDQKVKLQRAERDLKQAIKNAKKLSLSPEFLELYERDLDLRELEYRNSKTLNQLTDLADNDDEIGPKIIKLMSERDLKMPHLLQKIRSFASWRSEISEMSFSSSREQLPRSSSRSSNTTDSNMHMKGGSSLVSVVSIDFPGKI